MLVPRSGSGGIWVDATLGMGGHASAILGKAGANAKLVGIDQDAQARAIAADTLQAWQGRTEILAGNFSQMDELLPATAASAGADGILMDIGVSSLQLDEAERGFSFGKDGPLDMRMDTSRGNSAAEWLNSAAEKEIEEVLREYGEEKRAKGIARAIVQHRPLQRTAELLSAVRKVLGRGKPGEGNPAARTFQAVRIKINQELEVLERALPLALKFLKPGGRLGVISFHSLEDRIVKRFFEQESKDCICPPQYPACVCTHKAQIERLTRKPLCAEPQECAENPRARSARFRVVVKKEG